MYKIKTNLKKFKKITKEHMVLTLTPFGQN